MSEAKRPFLKPILTLNGKRGKNKKNMKHCDRLECCLYFMHQMRNIFALLCTSGVRVYMCLCVCVCVPVCLRVCVYMCLCTSVSLCLCIRVFVYLHVYVSMCLRFCVSVWLCGCVSV